MSFYQVIPHTGENSPHLARFNPSKLQDPISHWGYKVSINGESFFNMRPASPSLTEMATGGFVPMEGLGTKH